MARQVEGAVEAGDGDMDLRGLRQRLAANPKDLDVRILLARLYTRRGYPDLALEHYRLAAAQFPDAPVTVISLAKALRDFDEADEALRVIEAYQSRHADGNWELLSIAGVLYDEKGDFRQAEAAYRAALALDAGRAPLHNNLGYNLLLQGKPMDASAEFRRALELDPRSQIAHNNLAEALLAQGGEKPSGREALSEWQRSEGAAAAHNNMAAAMIEQGRFADARLEIDAALAEKPGLPEAMANLKLASEQDGQPATLRPRQPHFWKRVTSVKGIFGSSRPAQKTATDPGKIAAAGPVAASQDAGADGAK